MNEPKPPSDSGVDFTTKNPDGSVTAYEIKTSQRGTAQRAEKEAKYSRILAITAVVVAMITTAAVWLATGGVFSIDLALTTVTGVALVAGVVATTVGRSRERLEQSVADQLRLYSFTRLEAAETKIAQESKQGETDFASLWAVNQQRINIYHDTAIEQSRRSFRNSQYAMGAGLIVVLATVIAAGLARSGTGAIAAGIIGAVGTAASGYIGATFVKSQTEASAQFREFFSQPVEFSRMLGAERLIDLLDSDEKKAEAIAYVVRSTMMIAREPAPPASKDS